MADAGGVGACDIGAGIADTDSVGQGKKKPRRGVVPWRGRE
jgi:hypothetical protein